MRLSLRARGLACRINRVTALSGVDLDLEPGTCTGVTGRPGSGKTSLLKLLAQELRPSEGVVTVDGVEVADTPVALRRRIMLVDGRPLRGQGLRVGEWIAFVCAARGVAPAEAAVADALARVSLRTDAALDRLPAGGDRRVSLACAMVATPDLLLLDEPWPDLDPETRAACAAWVARQRDDGRTIVIAFEEDDAARALCSHIVRLGDGRIVQAGRTPPADGDVG